MAKDLAARWNAREANSADIEVLCRLSMASITMKNPVSNILRCRNMRIAKRLGTMDFAEDIFFADFLQAAMWLYCASCLTAICRKACMREARALLGSRRHCQQDAGIWPGAGKELHSCLRA
ncbi:hypothetical protein [Camelimonas lactis]|uniref:hypothetical protein n=1 Tax=Camelimonas lactis TaxID=659006 RepID=UPI00104BAAC2|nr:hypothetical protein [Camelimonas lactis]